MIGASVAVCALSGAFGVAGGAAWRRLRAAPSPLLEASIGLALLLLVAAAATVGMHAAWTGRWVPDDTASGLALLAALVGTAAGHAALVGWARGTGVSLALRRADSPRLALGAVAGAITVGVSAAYVEVAARLGFTVTEQGVVRAALDHGEPIARAATVAFIVLLAPVLEELVFRGYLYAVLEARGGRMLAAAGTAVAFTLFHAADPQVLAPIAVLAMILSALRARTGSVWPGTVAHVINNGLALALAGAFG